MLVFIVPPHALMADGAYALADRLGVRWLKIAAAGWTDGHAATVSLARNKTGASVYGSLTG